MTPTLVQPFIHSNKRKRLLRPTHILRLLPLQRKKAAEKSRRAERKAKERALEEEAKAKKAAAKAAKRAEKERQERHARGEWSPRLYDKNEEAPERCVRACMCTLLVSSNACNHRLFWNGC